MSSPCPSCDRFPDCLLSPLTRAELNELASHFAALNVPARVTIYSVGDSADRVCLVCTGVIKVLESDSDGTNRILGFIRAGQMFGLDSLVSDREHTRTAIARQNSSIIQIDRAVFGDALKKSTALLWRFSGMLNLLLRQSQERHLASSGGLVRRRIAATLLGCDGDLQLSQLELSELLGVPTETINREIAKLHIAGLVENKDGGIIPSNNLRRRASPEH
jgi:CRP-like cAMP-binding protein